MTNQRPCSHSRSSTEHSSAGGGDHPRLVLDPLGGHRGRRAGDRRRARPVGPEPEGGVVRVAVDHLDVLGGQADHVGDDLGEGRLVPLALGLHAEAQLRLAGRVDAQLAAVGHPEPEDVHVLARTGPDALGEEGEADPHERRRRVGARLRRGGASLGLLAAQLLVAGDAHRLRQRPGVVAGVVLPAGGRHVGELLGPQQVLHPQLGRVHLQLEGEAVDHPLDEVHRLGDAERAGVGNAPQGLVGVHGSHLAVRRRVVVGAGEDVEEAGGELGRLGDPVEGAVVGEHVDPQGEDLALPRGGDLAVHVVVAGEGGRHQVLGAVLHPLHRGTGDDRADDRQHVAGVDADLVAEPAADVGRDDLDLVLG